MPANGSMNLTQRTATWCLLFLTIALIAYGSFYPFNWDWARLATANGGHYPTSLPWGRTIRSDIVANLLFYIPLGALLIALSSPRRAALVNLVSAVGLGTALSVCVEYLQHATPPRTPSLTDVLLNSASTGIGAIGYWWLRRAVGMPQLRARGFDPALLALLGLWAAFHMAPFLPSVRLRQIYNALQPVLEFDLTLGGSARYFASYLIVSAALRALVKRENFWLTYTTIALLSMASRLLVVGQMLSPDEILGFLLALPLVVALRDTPHRRAAMPLLLVVVIAWFVYALAPFDFQTRAQTFQWVPFVGFLENNMDRAYVQFLAKLFLYLGFVWLAAHAGFRARTAGVIGACIAAMIEGAQIYLPGRNAEITDPLLVLVCAVVVALAGTGAVNDTPGTSRPTPAKSRRQR
jgi:VanZ family protein